VRRRSHPSPRYDGAFVALAFFRQARAEAVRQANLGQDHQAWKEFVWAHAWWNAFLARRERARAERRGDENATRGPRPWLDQDDFGDRGVVIEKTR